MKTFLLLLLALPFAGCASIKTGTSAVTGDTTVTMGNTTVDLGTLAAKVASASQLAVQNAVPVALAKNPSLRPDLVAAGQALTVALGNGTTDISTLESLVNSRVSAGNRAAVDEGMAGVIAIYEAFAIAYGSSVPGQEWLKYATEILTGINNGLAAGLAASPAPTAVTMHGSDGDITIYLPTPQEHFNNAPGFIGIAPGATLTQPVPSYSITPNL